MNQNGSIDHGKMFDWGKTSLDYGKYRDIYPPKFYQKILDQGLCAKGQTVLDLGTGTGVLPRNLYEYGAQFTGIDPSENQIQQAKALAERDNMKIRFQCVSAEACDFPPHTFDAVTACQCFDYFNHPVLAPRLRSMLKENGRFAILYMAWLPEEDDLAGNSERLILKYNPMWTGCNEKRRPISIPQVYTPCFTVEHQEVFDLSVPFTRETWRGRIRSCRGIGASLSDDEIAAFDREHAELLEKIAPECFEILHYAALAVLKRI